MRVAFAAMQLRKGVSDMPSGTGDKLGGKANELEGSVKRGVGTATGDEDLRSDGTIDQAKGKGKEVLGGAKDTLDKAGDKLKDAVD